jgi:pimeloyl-ACP methyl ester carboxylesterase
VAAHIYLERSTMEPSAQAILQAFRKDDGFRKGMHIAHGDNADAVIQCWFDSWHTAAALDWDMRPILNQITCPTLVIQGEKDEYTAPQHAIDIADNIPDADLCLVEGATHMLPQDQPELFNQRLLRFLMAVRDRRLL